VDISNNGTCEYNLRLHIKPEIHIEVAMNWQINYDENEQIIFIKTIGVLDISSANLMRTEGFNLIKQHNCLRCLVDHSEIAEDALSTLDIYNLPKRYKELDIPRRLKMALVIPGKFMTNLKFYETVCRNNGYLVSIFFNRESALEWLKK